jgi:hypothetical protein
MMRCTLASLAMIVVLAGCQRGSQPDALAVAPAVSASVQDTQSATPGLYTIEARVPPLPADWAPLQTTIENYVSQQKTAFLAGLANPAARAGARQLPWDLDLSVGAPAHTSRLANVQIDGSSFTGGAHPSPIVESFTYDIRDRRVVGLDDLFSDPAAAELALAAEARKQLLRRLDGDEPLATDAQSINEGTVPGQHHFDVFTLVTDGNEKARGITLVFPPYQVAAYVAGTQTVDVPVDVFARWVKPQYRASFGLE